MKRFFAAKLIASLLISSSISIIFFDKTSYAQNNILMKNKQPVKDLKKINHKHNYNYRFLMKSFSIVGVCAAILLNSTKKIQIRSLNDGWKYASNYWSKISKHAKNPASQFEALARSYVCLTRIDQNNWINAYKNYLKSSEEFLKIAKQEKDESSYNFKINFVLAAVMKAEAQKCKSEAGRKLFSKYFESHERMNCSFYNCQIEWEKIIGIKLSYDAYARANAAEFKAKFRGTNCLENGLSEINKLWEEAANLWKLTGEDEELKKSFNSPQCLVAFQAFTKAKRLECLLECEKASKKEVAEAYFVAYEEDKKCNSLFHNAFAIEAFLEYLTFLLVDASFEKMPLKLSLPVTIPRDLLGLADFLKFVTNLF